MKHIINNEWKGGLKFEVDLDGHKILTDAPVENGGENQGPGPKKLLLSALAACTGMDVVTILKKMRVDFEKCNIIVEGDLVEEHPKYYEKMHVIYEFTGKNLPLEKIEKVVHMSESTYCGVEALYKKAIPVTSEIRIKES
ncbi:MAG: OsmC family protein [Porphyromonadaceae bacterium]|nr:OsmC family protein [Porphyromonadaceae bacterium]